MWSSVLLLLFCIQRRPPRSPLFPTRRSSDLPSWDGCARVRAAAPSDEAAGQGRAARGARGHVVGARRLGAALIRRPPDVDRKSTRLNSSHANISYAVFCLKKKNTCDLSNYGF